MKTLVIPSLLREGKITPRQAEKAEWLKPDAVDMNENSEWLICFCGRLVSVVNGFGNIVMEYPMKEPWVSVGELYHV